MSDNYGDAASADCKTAITAALTTAPVTPADCPGGKVSDVGSVVQQCMARDAVRPKDLLLLQPKICLNPPKDLLLLQPKICLNPPQLHSTAPRMNALLRARTEHDRCLDLFHHVVRGAQRERGEHCSAAGCQPASSPADCCGSRPPVLIMAMALLTATTLSLTAAQRAGAGEAEAAADVQPSCFPRFDSLGAFKQYLSAAPAAGVPAAATATAAPLAPAAVAAPAASPAKSAAHGLSSASAATLAVTVAAVAALLAL
jgi:hypothetical protein